MAGLPAAPFINLLSPLRLKSKTDDWDLPGPRAAALFSCYVIRVCHTPYYEKNSFGEILSAPSRAPRAAVRFFLYYVILFSAEARALFVLRDLPEPKGCPGCPTAGPGRAHSLERRGNWPRF